MTEPLQVGQFAIVDGEPVDRGPNAGVFHGKGPTDDRAELFLLAEGTTPAGEAFAGHVVSALGHSFATLDMSLTGSLRRLFVEAERNLQDWNRKSIAQHRVSIGLTAFGRRGDQAVLAQAGPSVSFLLHGGAVTTYGTDEEHARAIGAGAVVPQLTRIPFSEGDRLLLVSSPALQRLDGELIAGILQLPEEQVLPDLYRRVQGMRQVTVVLVTGLTAQKRREQRPAAEEEFVIDATVAGDSGNADGAMFQPSLFIGGEPDSAANGVRSQLREVQARTIEAVVPIMLAEAPAPLLRVAGDTTSMTRALAEGQARAARSRAAMATVGAEAVEFAGRPAWRTPGSGHVAHAVSKDTSGSHEPPPAANTRERKSQSFSRGLVSPGAPPSRPDLSAANDLPLVDDMAATRRRATSATRLSETLATENGAAIQGGAPLVRPRHSMGSRWKGNGSFGGGRTSLGTQLPPTWLVILGALVVLILIAGVVTIPRMLNDNHEARIATLMTGAEQRITASDGQADPAVKRRLLQEAQAMLLEARDLGGGTGVADTLLGQAAIALTAMDNIHEPVSVETVVSLEQFGTRPVAVSRMVIGNGAAYLLDVNAAQVLAVPFQGEPSAIFAENKAVGQARPIAIAELDQSDLGGPVLLIADSANHIWAYSGGTVRAIAFAPAANMAITDITVFGRDLYVLDAGQSAIFRYLQTPEGFPNAPLKPVASPDLAGGRRLMVDGEYITTDGNGTVHRFINGQVALTLSQAGIDKLLVAPETAQSPNKNEVAILDAANDRIVVLRRDGAFDRQYRHKDFAGASAFVLRNGEAYVFSGAQLRRVVLDQP